MFTRLHLIFLREYFSIFMFILYPLSQKKNNYSVLLVQVTKLYFAALFHKADGTHIVPNGFVWSFHSLSDYSSSMQFQNNRGFLKKH